MITPRRNMNQAQRTAANAEPTRYGRIRLDKNERNIPFSEALLERIRAQITSERISAYPECWPVYLKVAEHLGVPVDHLLLHMGSEQAIKLIFETYIQEDDQVLLHQPGFAMYPVYSHIYKARVHSLDYDADLHFDWDAFIGRIAAPLRMVVVENPNGIVGHPVPREVLLRILDRAKEAGAFVVVDEAYHMFHSGSAVDLVLEHDNLIITRSFSKAFGLAGLRAGCLVSRPENIAQLCTLKPAYELTSLTAMILLELFNAPDEIQAHVEEVLASRAHFEAGVKALGFETTPSAANFLTFRLGRELTEPWREKLAQEGILVRQPFREERLSDWIRVSIGTRAVHDRVLLILGQLVTNRPGRQGALGAPPERA